MVLSNIIRRHDYKQEQLDKKIIETNSLLAVVCKHSKIDLIDNIGVTGPGKKGLHPYNSGKEQIAGNLLTYIFDNIFFDSATNVNELSQTVFPPSLTVAAPESTLN